MSLLPILLSDCWNELERPRSSLLERHYGMTLRPEDLFDSDSARNADILVCRPLRKFGRRYQPYEMLQQQNKWQGASVVKADKDKFHVTLDVQHFLPEEISVKVVGNSVVVEGKHEEKEDEHGWISRQFLRKYLVPSQCDVNQVKSNLSSDGILAITAPRKPEAVEKRERVIEIQRTGKPAVQESNKAPGQPLSNAKTNTNQDKDKNEEQPTVEKKTIPAA